MAFLTRTVAVMRWATGNNQPPAALASVQTVRGAVHYERRLHLLMLKEEEKDWQRNATAKIAALAAAQAALPAPSPSPPLPDFEPPIEPAEISGTTVTADGMFQLDAAGSMEVCRADTASPPVQQPAGASRSSSGSDLPALARLYLPPKADKPEARILRMLRLRCWIVFCVLVSISRHEQSARSQAATSGALGIVIKCFRNPCDR